LFIGRYFAELRRTDETKFNQANPWQLATIICQEIGRYDFWSQYWSIDGNIPKRRVADKLEVVHPADRTRILTSTVTTQRSQAIIDTFHTVGNADDLDKFNLEVHRIVARRYPRAIYLQIQAVEDPEQQRKLEIKLYRLALQMVNEMESGFQDHVVHPDSLAVCLGKEGK
jgi:hypothetical protein